jgi:hypothetical protein
MIKTISAPTICRVTTLRVLTALCAFYSIDMEVVYKNLQVKFELAFRKFDKGSLKLRPSLNTNHN